MKNHIVTKSNKLTEASYHLTLIEQRMILACIAPLDSRKPTEQTMEITTAEYAEYFGLDSSNAHRDLYSAASQLYERSIKIKNEHEERDVRWLQEKAVTLKGEGKVKLIFSNTIVEYISNLKKHFTSYKLRHVSDLKSVYSIRLYELLIQYKNKGLRRVLTLKEFKQTLALEDKYPSFKDLNKRVIKPSIKELNEKSDLKIEFSTEKVGRKVEKLVFKFKIDEQMTMDL